MRDTIRSSQEHESKTHPSDADPKTSNLRKLKLYKPLNSKPKEKVEYPPPTSNP